MSQEASSPSPQPPPPTPLDGEATYGSLKRFILPGLFVLLLFVVLLMRRPPQKKASPSWVFRGPIFGTTYTIKAHLRKRPGLTKAALHKEIKRVLQDINQEMSTYLKSSSLSSFNRSKATGRAHKISAYLRNVLVEARRISRLTGGAFDVTVGPLVNLWGFGPSGKLKAPKPEDIKRAKRSVGIDKLQISRSKGFDIMRKSVPGLYVDLSAIAKGYAVDAVGRKLEQAKIRDYMVEIGGEVRARGKNLRGVAWRIGVEKPQSSQGQTIQLVVPLRDASMATSGNYRNYLMVNGKKVSHLIDARTGIPVANDVSSVTVVHRECMTADALATALFVLGPKEGFALAKKHKWKVLFLIPKGKGFIKKATPGFARLLEGAPKSPAKGAR